jgi:hypothetical protein
MQRSKGAFTIHLLRPSHLETNGVALAQTFNGSGKKCLPGSRAQPAIANDNVVLHIEIKIRANCNPAKVHKIRVAFI